MLKETSDGVAATKLFRYDNHAECAPKLANSPCKLGPPLGPDDPHYVPQDPLCWPRYNKTAHADYDNECTIHIEIEQDMKAPIYFYYQIDNFYQNQRVYVKSQAPFQLKGGPEGDKWADKREYQDALAKSCSSSGYDRCRTGAVPALPRDGDGSSNAGLFLCNPCGLIASSFFTDTFEVERVATGALLAGQDWTQGGIAWESDVRDKYRATDPSNLYNKRLEDQNKLVTDPDFIVWCTAPPPTHNISLSSRAPSLTRRLHAPGLGCGRRTWRARGAGAPQIRVSPPPPPPPPAKAEAASFIVACSLPRAAVPSPLSAFACFAGQDANGRAADLSQTLSGHQHRPAKGDKGIDTLRSTHTKPPRPCPRPVAVMGTPMARIRLTDLRCTSHLPPHEPPAC